MGWMWLMTNFILPIHQSSPAEQRREEALERTHMCKPSQTPVEWPRKVHNPVHCYLQWTGFTADSHCELDKHSFCSHLLKPVDLHVLKEDKNKDVQWEKSNVVEGVATNQEDITVRYRDPLWCHKGLTSWPSKSKADLISFQGISLAGQMHVLFENVDKNEFASYETSKTNFSDWLKRTPPTHMSRCGRDPPPCRSTVCLWSSGWRWRDTGCRASGWRWRSACRSTGPWAARHTAGSVG